jgi:hypothetical protein
VTVAPAPEIKVWFGLPFDAGEFFALNDEVRGELDGDYALAGDVGTLIDTYGFAVNIRRGRSRELDETTAGTCSVALRNIDRLFDPLSPVYLTDELGNILTDDDDNELVVDGSTYAASLTPGRRVTIKIYGQVIFDGSVEDWNLVYEPNGFSEAGFVAVDALGMLARKEFNDWTTTAGQTAGQRIADVLNRSEVAFPYNRDLDAGISTLQADNVSWGSNVLNYLQLVTKSELGNLFASRRNVITFRDRHSTVSAEVAAEFRDDGTAYPFHGLEIDVGAELMFNKVGVDREGGTLQTADNVPSQEEFGIRTLNLTGLLMDDDTQSLSMAEFLVQFYGPATARVSAVTVNVSSLDTTQQAVIAALDIGDVVKFSYTPYGVGAEITQTGVVEGVEHLIPYTGPHMATFRLSPITQTSIFILDDEARGTLNAGGSLAF